MALCRGDLNDTDEAILDVLSEGRATPGLVRIFLEERGRDVTRQYVNARLKRLTEHDHVANLRDTGVYELVDDPQD